MVLPLNAAMELDAIGRTLYRLFVSRQNLLQWDSAAQLQKPSDKPPMLYFILCMLASGGMAAFSVFLHGFFLPGLIAALCWAALPFLLFLLEAPARRIVPGPREVYAGGADPPWPPEPCCTLRPPSPTNPTVCPPTMCRSNPTKAFLTAPRPPVSGCI